MAPAVNTVMIAGIAGASLGTEIAKSLHLAGGYRILGCDISPLAYGHFDAHFDATFQADAADYTASVTRLCREQGVSVLIPGGERPAQILGQATVELATQGIRIAQNDPGVVALASDKARCFERLAELGLPCPRTVTLRTAQDARSAPLPCIVKPSVDSGGSSFVFFARTAQEAELYTAYLLANGIAPVAQAYLPEAGGEFTVGVLSTPEGSIAGSIALRRVFHNKLSVSARGADFLISSGYSQGRIEDFPAIRATCEDIARALGSRGPLNVQGRVDADGTFVPFEINPRFSASTYLRALAGFGEVDHFLHLMAGTAPPPLEVRPGWYLRTLSETAVTSTAADPATDP